MNEQRTSSTWFWYVIGILLIIIVFYYYRVKSLKNTIKWDTQALNKIAGAAIEAQKQQEAQEKQDKYKKFLSWWTVAGAAFLGILIAFACFN